MTQKDDVEIPKPNKLKHSWHPAPLLADNRWSICNKCGCLRFHQMHPNGKHITKYLWLTSVTSKSPTCLNPELIKKMKEYLAFNSATDIYTLI